MRSGVRDRRACRLHGHRKLVQVIYLWMKRTHEAMKNNDTELREPEKKMTTQNDIHIIMHNCLRAAEQRKENARG